MMKFNAQFQITPGMGLVLNLFLAFAFAWPMFGTYFFHPNEHMFAFGGDPLTLYYNVAYHSCYGSGTHLGSMAYPDGEMIFLTDAQGSLSILLAVMRDMGLPVCDYSTGIINSIAVWGYLLASALLYLLYRAFSLPVWRAAVFAALTAAMAPHLHRMIGHHGLSHTFLLPLTLLWITRKLRNQKPEWRDLAFFGVLLFFTFNNPYTGFGLCMIAFLSLLVSMIRSRKWNLKIGQLALISVSPLLIAFAVFELFDPYNDRIALQWGYFHYKARLQGLLAPPDSLMERWLRVWTEKSSALDFEPIMNLGFPVTLIILSFLCVYIFRRKWLTELAVPAESINILIAGGLMFLYASALIFLPFPEEWVELVLGKLLMFKASARIAWPFWYALVLVAVILIEHVTKKMAFSGAAYTVAIVLLTWMTDFAVFRKPAFRDTVHPNFFDAYHENEINTWLGEAKINPEDYQAIYLLPKLLTWTDHFQSEHNFFNQFFGMRTSLATGLPLASAMLSRMSIGQTAERIEFLSHPLIEKSLQLKFPDQRPLLLLRGKGTPDLKTGESYLMSIADTLFEYKDFMLLRLPLHKINTYSKLQEIKGGSIPEDAISESPNIYYNGGNIAADAGKAYLGDKCFVVSSGEQKIISLPAGTIADSTYQFSAWTYIEPSRYGLGEWSVRWFEAGIEKGREVFILSSSSEVHNQWVRADIKFAGCSNCSYEILYSNNRTAWLDEILIKPHSIKHYIRDGKQVLYEGFRIDLK